MQGSTNFTSVARKLYRSLGFVAGLVLLMTVLIVAYRESYVRYFGGRDEMISRELGRKAVSGTNTNLPDFVPDSRADAFFAGRTRPPSDDQNEWVDVTAEEEKEAALLVDSKLSSETALNLVALAAASAIFGFWVWIGWLFKPDSIPTGESQQLPERGAVNQ